VVEGSEASDGSGGEVDGEAIHRIAVGREVSYQPVALAGDDEVVVGVTLEVGERDDGEVIDEIAARPQVLLGRVLAADRENGGKIDGEEDA
jgi:hypothetical protein